MFVEFLIAFLPVYIFFLCLVQLGLVFTARLVTEHAALNGARALAVVGGDEPKRYDDEKLNRLLHDGKRQRAVRSAVLLTMAPLILNGVVQSVTVLYPRPDEPDGQTQTGTIELTAMGENSVSKVRVRVHAEAACRLALAGPIACGVMTNFADLAGSFSLFLPTLTVRAEAIFPYQGARYDYPP